MGEARLKKSATAKFIAQFPQCAMCGGQRLSTTREHMPPKALFDNSHRPDKLVMPACHDCNNGTSKADLTASMVSRWNYHSPEQERQDHSRLVNQVRMQAPELIKEWTSLNHLDRSKAIDHLRFYGVAVPDDAGVAAIGKQTIRQLNIFAHKATLCLYFERFKKPVPNVGFVSAHWRSKEDFAKHGIPTIFFELFPDYGTLTQGKWNAAETFEYRYAANEQEGLFGCLARFRTGLFVTGFAIMDESKVSEALDQEWIRPIQLLEDNPHFYEKR